MSWVIVDKATGKGVFETFNEDVAKAINTTKYDVVEIQEYLETLNAKIKAAGGIDPL
jgi:hypothetical protein